jgi:hypothetical protein
MTASLMLTRFQILLESSLDQLSHDGTTRSPHSPTADDTRRALKSRSRSSQREHEVRLIRLLSRNAAEPVIELTRVFRMFSHQTSRLRVRGRRQQLERIAVDRAVLFENRFDSGSMRY